MTCPDSPDSPSLLFSAPGGRHPSACPVLTELQSRIEPISQPFFRPSHLDEPASKVDATHIPLPTLRHRYLPPRRIRRRRPSLRSCRRALQQTLLHQPRTPYFDQDLLSNSTKSNLDSFPTISHSFHLRLPPTDPRQHGRDVLQPTSHDAVVNHNLHPRGPLVQGAEPPSGAKPHAPTFPNSRQLCHPTTTQVDTQLHAKLPNHRAQPAGLATSLIHRNHTDANQTAGHAPPTRPRPPPALLLRHRQRAHPSTILGTRAHGPTR